MDRKDVLKSPEYWIARIQVALYYCAEKFMRESGKNKSQLARHLGCSKGYVTQLLNGECDHKLSKIVKLSLAFGYVPVIDFVEVNSYIESESVKWTPEKKRGTVPYNKGIAGQTSNYSVKDSSTTNNFYSDAA